VLDFATYGGTVYPGLYTVEFCVWCADENGCPIGAPLWCSGPYETGYGFNFIYPPEPFDIDPCYFGDDTRILITAQHTGTEGNFPAWGMDNVGTAVVEGCGMHDIGCLPAIYPRPWNSYYEQMHSGYYGHPEPWEYCPPVWFRDGYDTTSDGTQYGYVELVWTIYVDCLSGVKPITQGTTWGEVKGLYK
jgi:hypothetical protein